jgi:hypothetical protein
MNFLFHTMQRTKKTMVNLTFNLKKTNPRLMGLVMTILAYLIVLCEVHNYFQTVT